MKRIVSVLMSIAIVLASFFPLTAYAESYEDILRSKGFPDSYITKLSQLHNLHPNWIFEPYITGLNWSEAVNAERTPHTDQLIENCSLYSNDMYCNCSNCLVNGSYKVQEGKNWVSASQRAVEYYMNPLNWLDEKHIFQFESTAYDGTQTKEGVEAILNGTWMNNSLITYMTTSGEIKQYDTVTQYSDAIMQASGNAGISAYYLASKIKQENGGQTASNTAVNGTTSPFQGIYNYYNIGAYTGAVDGLEWAAGFLKTNNATYLYPMYDSVNKIAYGMGIPVQSGQYMTWRADADNFFYVRLYDSSTFAEGASGYIPKADCRTTYFNHGRPWTNPYKAIYYGAQYISNSFGCQTTNYFQKFNVTTTNRFANEYMKNVAGASSEAVSTYNGYNSAGILDITKTFVIPVYNAMPDSVDVTGLCVADFTSDSVTLAWNGVENVSGYTIEALIDGSWQYCASSSVNYITLTNLQPCCDLAFRVVAFKQVGSEVIYGLYSNVVYCATKPVKMSKPTATSTCSSVKLKWEKQNNATGYTIYKYDKSKDAYKSYKSVSGDATSLNISGLSANTQYKFKIAAYKTINGQKYSGAKSDAVKIKTLAKNQVVLSSLSTPSKKKLNVKWKKLSGITGYEVMWSTSSNFKSNFLSVKVKGASKTSKALTTSKSKKTYYVRVRAYKTKNGKTTYYPWSSTKKIKVK